MGAGGVRATIRGKRGALEMALLKSISYVPLHAVRVAAVRAAGADLGPGVVLYHGFEIRRPQKLSIGAGSSIGNGAILDARGGLTIGEHVNFSTGVNVWTGEHDWRSPDFAYRTAPVTIGDHVWISTRATILPGAVIGDGAVVAAGAVVTGEVPPSALVAGVPATVIGERPPVDYRLGPKQWWW